MEGVSKLKAEMSARDAKRPATSPTGPATAKETRTKILKSRRGCKRHGRNTYYRHTPRPVSTDQLPKRDSCSISSLDDQSKVLVASERDLQNTVAMVSTRGATQTEEQARQLTNS